MADYVISGIQQAGIGVQNVLEAFEWYNRVLGMNIPVFEEAAEAALMLPYTGGKPQARHAILAINLEGGGGFEIWQYTSRKPAAPSFSPEAGDLGLYCAKMKCRQIEAAHKTIRTAGAKPGEIITDPSGAPVFYFSDPFGNPFQMVEDSNAFAPTGQPNGGVFGMTIGVSDLEKSKRFYSDLLGYDKVVFEGEGHFEDLKGVAGGKKYFRRAILTHSHPRKGPFSRLLGKSVIELLEAKDYQPRKIFAGRLWGDLGFIHLCFDIRNMNALKAASAKMGHPFTIDGGEGFEMGEAAGHFAYVEDPDGALIEFVETKKIPILKKFDWYLNLSKRNPEKPLPGWMLRTLSFNRRKV